MRILFISANRLGDAVLTMGVLSWLESQNPQASFTVACSPLTADLFRAVPRLDKMILLKKKRHHAHWIDLWRECVGTKWDIIVDFRNSLASRLLWGNKKYYPAPNKGEHKVIDHARMIGASPVPAPTLWLAPSALAKAQEIIGRDRPVIAFGPAANWPAKQWPIESFTALAQQLTATDGLYPNAKIMIAAAPHERAQLTPLFTAFDKDQIIDLLGQDLQTVTACLKQADLFVGNDSGLMHIAAAVGTPTIGLFGPGYEKIYGPWGDKTTIVRTPETAEELLKRLPKEAERIPCLMESLSVESVVQAAEKLRSL